MVWSWNGGGKASEPPRGDQAVITPEPSRAPDDTDTDDFSMFDTLVSRYYEPEPHVRVAVEFGAVSHPGKVRENNEDHFLVVRRNRRREVLLTNLPEGLLTATDESAYTMAVADGMGGHSYGELASLLALQAGWYFGSNEIKWVHKVNERETEEFQRKSQVFFDLINRTMKLEVASEPRLRGMGTTLTLAYSTGPELFVMHVGDSRAYLQRGSSLYQLTRDHTLSNRLIEEGLAQPGSPEERTRRHILTSSLGTEPAVAQMDFSHHGIENGDQVLLCTDGLTDLVDDAMITRLLGASPTAQAACEALLNEALDRGGKDNITVVLARYSTGAKAEPTPA